MIKEFKIGDKVHLVLQYHDSKDYTFQMVSQMPSPKYEAIIKQKTGSGASKGKIAKRFNLPVIKYTLEFVDFPDGDKNFFYSIEMFQEFYTLNKINPETLEIITDTTKDISTDEDVSTKSISDIESFTLNNNITIKF